MQSGDRGTPCSFTFPIFSLRSFPVCTLTRQFYDFPIRARLQVCPMTDRSQWSAPLARSGSHPRFLFFSFLWLHSPTHRIKCEATVSSYRGLQKISAQNAKPPSKSQKWRISKTQKQAKKKVKIQKKNKNHCICISLPRPVDCLFQGGTGALSNLGIGASTQLLAWTKMALASRKE